MQNWRFEDKAIQFLRGIDSNGRGPSGYVKTLGSNIRQSGDTTSGSGASGQKKIMQFQGSNITMDEIQSVGKQNSAGSMIVSG